MEPLQRAKCQPASGRWQRFSAWLLAICTFCAGPASIYGSVNPLHPRHTREHFRHNMRATIRADHPAIKPVADAIRAITRDPLQQLVVVHDVSHLLVDYDHDERVYGTTEFHATLDEMLARRRQAGWIYLRDDCDGRAVFAAHVLSALGIPWRLEASYWKEHAWIVARVNGVDYDLLDLRRNAPETNRLSYKVFGRFFVRASHRPPAFAWRRAWAEQTSRDLAVGLNLGLLAINSTPQHPRERYATDWTRRSPAGVLSPAEDRVLAAATAGFPLGEPLTARALAANTPAPAASVKAIAQNMGVATSSESGTTPESAR